MHRAAPTMLRYMYVFCVFTIVLGIVRCDASDESVTRIPPATSLPDTSDAPPDTTTLRNDEDFAYANRSMTGGNELWDSLLKECGKASTISCIQKNVYTYLNANLDHPDDYKVMDALVFKRNVVDYTKYSREVNEAEQQEEDEERSSTPLEEVTDALYGKGVKFMMTHDMQLKMPDTFFDGATLKVSPRGFEGNGALVKLEMVPREIEENRAAGVLPRFFKKIRKFFNNKLLMSFMSLMLIVKLIKVKLMFVMPVLVGVGTAKKILLKVLLFLFPAIAHIFKLCSYYHANYHSTKYHHHHHKIAHVHHQLPTHGYGSGPPEIAPHLPPSLPYGNSGPDHQHAPIHLHSPPVELDYNPHGSSHFTSPDIEPHSHHVPAHVLSGISLHHAPEIPHPPPKKLFQHQMDPFELSGPGLGPEYISNRNAYEFQPGPNDENEIKSWGLTVAAGGKAGANRKVAHARPGVVPHGKLPATSGVTHGSKRIPQGPLTKDQIKELALKAEKEVMLKARLQQEKHRLQHENHRLQEQLKAQEHLKIHQQVKLHETLKQQEKLLKQQQFIQKQSVLKPPSASAADAYSVATPPPPPPPPLPPQVVQGSGVMVVGTQISGHQHRYQHQHQHQHQQAPPAPPPPPSAAVGVGASVPVASVSIQKSIAHDYDPFYSPILQKIDAIFIKLGVNSEGCRDRVVCSMYKSPAKFSPHSNLLSAELSRESKDLQKPTSTNDAVIRYYKYVQAARDGQENHDCLRLYPVCTINTET